MGVHTHDESPGLGLPELGQGTARALGWEELLLSSLHRIDAVGKGCFLLPGKKKKKRNSGREKQQESSQGLGITPRLRRGERPSRQSPPWGRSAVGLPGRSRGWAHVVNAGAIWRGALPAVSFLMGLRKASLSALKCRAGSRRAPSLTTHPLSTLVQPTGRRRWNL